jgi:hypothetical protein
MNVNLDLIPPDQIPYKYRAPVEVHDMILIDERKRHESKRPKKANAVQMENTNHK